MDREREHDNLRKLQREQPETQPRGGAKAGLGITAVVLITGVIIIIGGILAIWVL